MELIDKNKFGRVCGLCKERIQVGESYLQTPIDNDGGIHLEGVHTEHFFENPKDAGDLSFKKQIQIEIICDTAVELVVAGMGITDAIEKAKKMQSWENK